MTLPVSRAGQWLALATCAVVLSACIDPQVGVRRTTSSSQVAVPRSSSQPSSVAQHIVQKGDTLYAIAFRYALDFRDIARWNGIADPYIIKPNQRLILRDPSQAPARPIEPPVQVATTTHTVPAYTPSSSTTSVQSNPPAQIGTAAPMTPGVSVGATVPDSQPSSVEPLSPTNAEGLPTGFASSSSASSAPPVSSTAVVATPGSTVSSAASAPSVQTHTDVPSAPPPELMAPKPNTVAVIQAPTLSTSSAVKPTAGANGWGWPVIGRVLTSFSGSDPGRQGVDISGNLGDPVHAAKGGDVVYSGRGIIGYGELIVIKHDDATLTAYGHNAKRSVKEGERVSQGQKIAEMGKAPNGQSLLHFEVRRNGKPIDPLSVLPARR